MRTLTRTVAIAQAALILPAVLFLTAVLVGAGAPPQYQLAHMAQRVVAWYSGSRWALELLLILLPLVALVAGGATLLPNWNGEPHHLASTRSALIASPTPIATLFVGWATLTSAGILTVIALHMLAH